MITPGFFSLFNAHRGLVAAQNALSTVNHNITNANTEGYSRQRVDLSAHMPYSLPTKHGPNGGQLGQGPVVQQITRSRDAFLDKQFRESTGVSGLDFSMRDVLQQIEGILNEPATSGINSAIQEFFDAAQELSLHPETIAVRADYMQHAIDLINVFQQQGLQLLDLRTNIIGDPVTPSTVASSQLAILVEDVNNLLSNIADLNKNIVIIKATGAQPNDLLDQRDRLLDQLSELVDIQVTNFDNGQVDIRIANQLMVKGTTQVDSLEVIANPGPAPTPDDMPTLLRTATGLVVLNDGAGAEVSSGRIKGIIDMGGNSTTLSSIRNVMGKLDTLLNTIVTQVNTLQLAGRDLNGNLGTGAIFNVNAALNPGQPLGLYHWEVNAAIVTDPRLVSAASDDATAPANFAGVGDGRNALAMARLRDQTFGALGTTMVDYFNSTVSKVGIDTRSYENSSASQNNLLNSIEMRRQSVSGVNVDEEMIDMLRFQRAFEATSKMIATLDEIMKTILNLV